MLADFQGAVGFGTAADKGKVAVSKVCGEGFFVLGFYFDYKTRIRFSKKFVGRARVIRGRNEIEIDVESGFS